ncbi:hypothetical protein SH580_03370 [Coraliomargarita algicola]|uniref:Uncharacterized protein n=1 Tax=Coraliomargarita algicola TaxID=3092156 RepID=A0ABZ0RNE4_9BACT|nr:hypothetical protein [Coraliomargarita sp. J2-16]WPJ96744.1 hypothetical protein SH580_03370 [Coraliomargarita sp. J2-16]
MQSKSKYLGRRGGFALILALSLMAFVVLLLISITTLVQVEVSNSVSSAKRLQAQANAMLGLQVAMGELQRLTGPDQRISGNALIMDVDVATPVFDSGEQAYWTGVWDATNGSLLSWLVSGNEGLAPSDAAFIDYDLDLSASTLTEVVQFLQAGVVEVPLRTFNGEDAYAYWVSDEGGKAKINQADTDASMPLISAQMLDITQMEGLEWMSLIAEQAVLRKKAVSLEQLKSLSVANASTFDSLAHDLTPSSFGVLSNTVDGGLKTDLTLALFDHSEMPAGQMFDPLDDPSVSSLNDPGGPLWTQLQSWVDTSLSAAGDLPVRATTDEQAGFFPVVTQAQLYVLPRYGAAPDRKVLLDVMPSVTLWNPYDKALEVSNYRVDFGRSSPFDPSHYSYHDIVFGNWSLYLDLDGDGSFTSVSNSEKDERKDGDEIFYLINTDRSSQLNDMPGLSFTIADLRLEAGEAITFSAPSGNHPIDAFISSGPEGRLYRAAEGDNELEPGFRLTSSYYIDTGWDLSSIDPFVAPKFKVSALRTASQSVQLVKTSGSDSEVLSEFFGMGGQFVNGAPTIMSSSSDILGYPDLNGSVGFKILRNFVEIAEDPTVRWLSQFNPRGRMQGPIPLSFHDTGFADFKNSQINNPSFQNNILNDGLEFTTGVPSSGSAASVGFSTNTIYPKQAVLYESPPARDELRSIGQLMHAPLYYSGVTAVDANEDGSIDNDISRQRMQWSRIDNLIPAYAVGSSLADSMIPLDRVDLDWTEYPITEYWYNYVGRHYDYSYLLNQALWDGYFFSSLPTPNSRTPANQRFVALDSTATATMSAGNVAAEFLLEGAFNVNSTSENAWRALLAAFYGESLNGTQETGSPYVRINDLSGDPFKPSIHDVESPEAYLGYRTLTAPQIKNLARQIVKEVKRRGPFTSMARFVNRSLDQDAPSDMPNGGVNAYRVRGALSAALLAADQITADEAADLGITVADARINGALQQATEEITVDDVRTDSGFIQEAQVGWRSEDIPGWLTQADLLSRLGAGLTVRSDTFKIRVCGRVNDPISGAVQAEVFGEATVQRLPQFFNLADAADTQIADLTNDENKRFGRRYIVVDFHWIE